MKEAGIPKIDFKTHEAHYDLLVILFGLCNAPSTFQSLMNNIFKPFLCNFVLVFFNDILIYNKTWESHIEHIDKSSQILRDNQLFLKPSKCAFSAHEVEYLGHIVSQEGVRVDPNKVKTMQD
jgi:hypothetical protein